MSAVLTTSKGLEQRLDADVKEARILLAGRHACGECVAVVTGSRGGRGCEEEEEVAGNGGQVGRMRRLRPDCTGGGWGARDAGGQPLMWTLQLCNADSVQRD